MKRTDKEIRDVAHAVLYEVALFIGLYARLFQGETSTDRVICNACLEAWLLHARNLIAFFETPQKKRYKDDVISDDYGFPAQRLPINSTIRVRLNKDLTHLTFARIERTRNTSESKQKKNWDPQDFLPLLKRCDEFVPHMQRDYPAGPDDAWLLSECAKAHSLLALLAKTGR